MSENFETKTPKRAKPKFISAILSMGVILFILAGILLLAYFGQKYLNSLKEKVEFELILKNEYSPAEKVAIENKLTEHKNIKNYYFLSKEEAAKQFQTELGQDFIDLLGFNPLYDAYIIQLKSSYTAQDSINLLQSKLLEINGVSELNYDKTTIGLINTRFKKLSFILGGVCIFFLFIAITLIDSSIRLMMFSQRFIIRSMQLLGATQWLVIKPFLKVSIKNGIISALVAILSISGILYYIHEKFSLKFEKDDFLIFASTAILLIAVGIIISSISTMISVRKYIYMKLDELY